MAYHIDLSTISIEMYMEKLKKVYLPPSRMILKEGIDERFTYFTSLGIKNLGELLQTLKKKDKFNELSKISLFPGNYLTILLRELNSMLPKPIKLKDYPGISPNTIARLEKAGIKTSLDLFEKLKNRQNRDELSLKTGISQDSILELTALSDLSRIKWTGAVFSRMLYDIGIHSVEKASKADPVDLHQKITILNEDKKYFNGKIGLKDIITFVAAAGEVPVEVEY